MNLEEKINEFETLDPKDWAKARALMHQMVDDAIDYTANIRSKKVWQEMPDDILNSFNMSVPYESSDPGLVYDEFKKNILPYPMGNIHPRFWGWYMGNGTVSGYIGDFWASVMNPNLGGGNHAAHKVEEQVINWIKEIMHFPLDSSGLLVSGGSMANFTALAVARNAKSGYDIRNKGITSELANKMVVYASNEIHSSNQKALELLGLGAESLHKIATNENYTINVDALKNQILIDKNEGLFPIAVIGTSGTINTGAIDDLNSLADLCEKESLWFHVDGAIGAIAIITEQVKPQLEGIERADSIALDLHKWLHMPFEVGCVLIKDKDAHKNTFSLIPEYLQKNTRGLGSGANWFSEYGLQLSRRFNALKVWMSIKEHGVRRFGRMISRNIDQANYLGKLIIENEKLELIAPIGLDIVCFRYNPGNMSNEELNSLNKEIKLQIEEQGIAFLGYTTLHDKYCIRIAIANHRSTSDDFDILIESILKIAQELIYK